MELPKKAVIWTERFHGRLILKFDLIGIALYNTNMYKYQNMTICFLGPFLVRISNLSLEFCYLQYFVRYLATFKHITLHILCNVI